MTVMIGDSIKQLCEAEKPLIRNAINLETQIQQNGIDLTLKKVERLESSGVIDFDNSARQLPKSRDIKPTTIDGKLVYCLDPGVYVVTFNEIVAIPKTFMARACPRSSLIRCGVDMNTAVWDAGFEGQSLTLMVVHNPYGVWIHQNARIVQLVLEKLDSGVEQGYSGIYQGDGI